MTNRGHWELRLAELADAAVKGDDSGEKNPKSIKQTFWGLIIQVNQLDKALSKTRSLPDPGNILWLCNLHDVTETLSLADNSETIENNGDLESGQSSESSSGASRYEKTGYWLDGPLDWLFLHCFPCPIASYRPASSPHFCAKLLEPQQAAAIVPPLVSLSHFLGTDSAIPLGNGAPQPSCPRPQDLC
ncbi:hypothetical protein UY3_00806 [Chelonia mydas]|uniref:Uncharacterized protein n=1 Tax=Chelonia mydas TaxID=8469 RepID=M7C1C5_CHEMY|nr:hypothetical protein UY3_00806 [Chelonia mydas]